MSAPGTTHANFARGLMYVALSRSTSLKALFLIHHAITAEMFTKWAAEMAEIDTEYSRLRALPRWTTDAPGSAMDAADFGVAGSDASLSDGMEEEGLDNDDDFSDI